MAGGQELRLISAVPLSDQTGGIPGVAEEAGDGDLVRVQPLGLAGEQDGSVVDAPSAEADNCP
jgi:hypothetical protein